MIELLRRLFGRRSATPVAPVAPRPTTAVRPKAKTRLVAGSAAAAMAVALVGAWEGLRTEAYLDIVDVPTVCYGETRGVKLGDRYTRAQCGDMLVTGLRDFEAGMRRCLANPDAIADETYVAMLSATYNVGVAGFCGSSMARRLNAGDVRGACDALLLWNKAGGRVVQGLVNRRQDERRLCLKGVS